MCRVFEVPAGAGVVVEKLQRKAGVVLDLRVIAHACGGRGQVLHGLLGTLQLQRQAANRLVQLEGVRESLESRGEHPVSLEESAFELGAGADLGKLHFGGLGWWRQLRRRLRAEMDVGRGGEVVRVLGVTDERSSRVLQLEG